VWPASTSPTGGPSGSAPTSRSASTPRSTRTSAPARPSSTSCARRLRSTGLRASCGRCWPTSASPATWPNKRPSPSRAARSPSRRPLPHLVAVHLAQRVGDQLEAGPVRVAEVDRGPALGLVLHTGLVEAGLGLRPLVGVHGDGDVVQPAQYLGVGPQIEAGEV